MADSNDNLAALSQQLACYRKLARLSDLQRSYVQQNQTDELLVVLQARAQVLGDIQRLEAIVGPLKKNWAEQSAGMSASVRDRASAMLVEAKSLLQQITQADQDDVLLLQQRKLNVGKQIQATSSARRINTKYAANAYSASSGSKLNVQQ